MRFHAFDNLRAATMLLGIWGHAGMAYMTIPLMQFPIRDRDTSVFFDFTFYAFHLFRMPVFFMLAGFFGRMIHDKLGTREFMRDRTKRILIPFLAGWAVLYVPIVATTSIGARTAPFNASTVVPGDLESALGSTLHLWFLYYLIFYYALAVIFSRRFTAAVSSEGTRQFRRLLLSRWRNVMLAVPVTAGLWMSGSAAMVQDNTFLVDPIIAATWGLFFAFGWLLFPERDIIHAITDRPWRECVTAVALMPLNVWLMRQLQPGTSTLTPAFLLLGAFTSAIMTWSATLGVTGIFVRYANRVDVRLRYVADASYWMYLVHLPLVIWGQILLLPLDVPAEVKFTVVLTVTTGLLLASYALFVRNTVIGETLNGRRRSSVRMSIRRAAFPLLLLLVSCAPARLPVEPLTKRRASRPVPYPVLEPLAFSRAVAKGTRTRTGEPGPRYWQQWTEYRLRASLDPLNALLRGRGGFRYSNRSPDRLDSIAVHLHQNLYAPTAVRNRPVPLTGGVTLQRLSVGGASYPEFRPQRGTRLNAGQYRVDGTIAWIRLRTPLMPGASVDLDFEWSFTVPGVGSPRMGTDKEVFHIAYWYPQVAVYDDVSGWHVDPYLSNAEFYMGFGNYDVSIEVPDGWLVSATGTLVNASEVLTPQTRERLTRARTAPAPVQIVNAEQRVAGVSTIRARNGRLTWRFTARNVRDFAWNTSNRYVWDATRAVIPSPRLSGSDTVAIHALYRPGTAAWDRAAEYGRHSIEYLSRFLWPYPYEHMTAVEGLISGGMEFPMLTLIGGNRDTLSLQSVVFHEIGHMWFPMIVGSDEKRHSWQDEGLTRFNQIFGRRDIYPGADLESTYVGQYVEWALTGDESPVMREGDYHRVQMAYRRATYEKPAVALVMLRDILGQDLFMRAYREYGRRWSYKHPQPYDLWNTFNSLTGRNLDWFWRTWFFETWVLDQAIASVTQRGPALLVTIEDRGLAPMPVLLSVTRTNGNRQVEHIPVDVWLSGVRSHTVRVPDARTVRRIDIDPDRRYADVDRSNQSWVPGS